MKHLKKFFSTPLRAVVSCVCILVILGVIGAGAVFAVNTVARGTAIGAETAQNFAFADAGVDPAAVQLTGVEFDFEQGQFVYEISFLADGTEYGYLIRSSDGTVVKKEMKLVAGSGSPAGGAVSAQITLNKAKEIALADAGVAAADAVFTETKLDWDDGAALYEIQFWADRTEYEYEIHADTGAIFSKSKETHTTALPGQSQSTPVVSPQVSAGQTQPVQSSQPVSGGQIDAETAKNAALADAGVNAADATFTKSRLDWDDGIQVYDVEFYTATHEYDYEIDAATGAIRSRDVEAFQVGGQVNSGAAYIGVDEAKAIAAAHAGIDLSQATFSKAKLENDDGYTLYEVEFYSGGMEYEYKINAYDGAILEYDTDWID